MADQILIQMPGNLRDFLMAIPAVQDYQIQLVIGGQKKERDPNWLATFRMKEEFKYFESVLRVVKEYVPVFDYSGWNELSRGEYDCFIDMDCQRAMEVTRCNRMHMAQALSLLIGAGLNRWPVLRYLNLKPPEQPLDVLILKWDTGDESKKFSEKMLEEHPELVSVFDDRNFDEFEKDPEQLIAYINMFRCVIGPMGASTYIAATLKKGLIEIFKDYDDMLIYSNAGIPYYQQVIGSPVWQVMWRLWQERWIEFRECLGVKECASQECLSVTNDQDRTPQMALPQSTVGNAEEKSLEK